jgi:hypothetical protein
MAKYRANGLSDVGWRENGESYLIKERLKRVMVLTINDSNLNREVMHRLGCVKASKSCTDDYDARASVLSGLLDGLRQFAHVTSLLSVWMPEEG